MTSEKGSGDSDVPDKDKRRRFVYQLWERNSNGPILKRGEAPEGYRTPNGQVWGHTLSDFFWIERIPGVCVRTIWSTSMLQKLNDSLSPSQKELLAEDEHHFPRVLQPWPLLCIPNDNGDLETLCLGGDEGCERGHDPRSILHRVREVGDHLEAGPMRMRDLTPEQKQRLISAARINLKQTLTNSMSPKIINNDPRFHIPDQSVPWNERLPPKLEEFIPKEYLPDVLLVHDPYSVAGGEQGRPGDCNVQFEADVPIRYIRTLPEPTTGRHSSNFAHLYLSPNNLCGHGNHSFVYYAPLMLSAPLTARTPTRQVTVLAKTSFPESEHRDLLSQEGIIYDAFPQWMMEDYCGYNIVDQIIYPVPACAIVPKFYGFYVPEDESQSHLSPILLLEDCGLPITESTLDADDRTQLQTMFINLHNAGFLQGSVYPRNILIQPGPLTIHPLLRSLASPSFRIIDFGRADYKQDFIHDAIGVAALERYNKWLKDYDDFITTVGADEAEKEYTITVYDNEDGGYEDKGMAKSREVTMVMGLEKDKWTKLSKAWSNWSNMVREANGRVRETLGVGF